MLQDPEGYWETVVDAGGSYDLADKEDDEKPMGPCVQSSIALREIRGATGRLCPRVELRMENWEAQQVIRSLINHDTKALAGHAFALKTAGLPQEEQEHVLDRVLNTMNDPRVVECLHPKQKTPQQPRKR